MAQANPPCLTLSAASLGKVKKKGTSYSAKIAVHNEDDLISREPKKAQGESSL